MLDRDMNPVKEKGRLTRLREVFDHGAGLTLRALSVESGVSTDVLSRSYQSKISEETMLLIAKGAARVLAYDEAQFVAWFVCGEDEPALEAFFDRLLTLKECTACHGWFLPEQIVACRCRPCLRPDSTEWEKRIDSSITLSSAPPNLRRAWYKLRAAGVALTYEKLADEVKMPKPQLRRVWVRSGLEEKPRKGRTRPTRYAEWVFVASLAGLTGTRQTFAVMLVELGRAVAAEAEAAT